MLRKTNLLTAGLMVVLTAVGQSSVIAGHGPGGGSSGGGIHVNQLSSNSMGARPSFSVQTPVNKNLGTVMQGNSLKTQLQTSHLNTVLQTNKLNTVHLPNNLNQGTLGNVKKIDPKFNLPLNSQTNQLLKGTNFPNNIVKSGKIDPIFSKPMMPIKPQMPICPPLGLGTGKCGNGGCWGNCCNFGWGFGCGNWYFGNCGCGYWPGYFGNYYGGCYGYPVYPIVTTPVVTNYVTTTPVVEVVPPAPLSDQAVPPTPTSTRELDLGIKDVRIVEAATVDRGALYRVSIINKGPADLDVPARVAALGIKDSQPTEDTPRVMEMIKSLKVGESVDVDLRMPVAANALPRLLVAVEIPENFKDTNEMNNVAAGEVAQLQQLASVK